MKPISFVLCLLAMAAAAGGLILGSEPTRAAAPLAPAARPGAATIGFAPAQRGARAELGTAASYAPPGTPLGAEALAAIRAAALERVERERSQTLFERQQVEGDWLRVLGHEVGASVGLDAAGGQLLSAILVQERDDQTALWNEVRGMKNKRASRQRLAAGMRAITAARRAQLEQTFGAPRAAEIQALLDEGGPGDDGEPGALARAGY